MRPRKSQTIFLSWRSLYWSNFSLKLCTFSFILCFSPSILCSFISNSSLKALKYTKLETFWCFPFLAPSKAANSNSKMTSFPESLYWCQLILALNHFRDSQILKLILQLVKYWIYRSNRYFPLILLVNLLPAMYFLMFSPINYARVHY